MYSASLHFGATGRKEWERKNSYRGHACIRAIVACILLKLYTVYTDVRSALCTYTYVQICHIIVTSGAYEPLISPIRV